MSIQSQATATGDVYRYIYLSLYLRASPHEILLLALHALTHACPVSSSFGIILWELGARSRPFDYDYRAAQWNYRNSVTSLSSSDYAIIYSVEEDAQPLLTHSSGVSSDLSSSQIHLARDIKDGLRPSTAVLIYPFNSHSYVNLVMHAWSSNISSRPTFQFLRSALLDCSQRIVEECDEVSV